MKNLSLEQIILLIIFILGPLVNILIHRVRRRSADQALEREPETLFRRQARVSETDRSLPRVPRTRADASEPPAVSTPRFAAPITRKSLLGSKRELRRGIIIMTVLGPCRAYDPPD
jgi:hypothetical protein